LTGYKEWSRELSIQAGSEAHLTANLQQNEAVRVADETHASNSPTITDYLTLESATRSSAESLATS
ncbi:MAG TPA: hypothetical protein VNY51_14150, partial [Candidatus Dormibacteraeota bacterium]|nr:hypothetical protein [Candidatus Dormibacteraeota bacterium]